MAQLPAQPDQATDEEVRTVYLISCVSAKAALPSPAKDLYLSPWFRKAIAYALSQSHSEGLIFVLSAKHGLVALDQLVAPYNLSLNDMPVAARQEWAAGVYSQIQAAGLSQDQRFVFLAGLRYREFLAPLLAGGGAQVSVRRGWGSGSNSRGLGGRCRDAAGYRQPQLARAAGPGEARGY